MSKDFVLSPLRDLSSLYLIICGPPCHRFLGYQDEAVLCGHGVFIYLFIKLKKFGGAWGYLKVYLATSHFELQPECHPFSWHGLMNVRLDAFWMVFTETVLTSLSVCRGGLLGPWETQSMSPKW